MKIDHCDHCHFLKMVNQAWYKGHLQGWYCGDCWPNIDHDGMFKKPPGRPTPFDHDDAGPWQENAIRDLEEDR